MGSRQGAKPTIENDWIYPIIAISHRQQACTQKLVLDLVTLSPHLLRYHDAQPSKRRLG